MESIITSILIIPFGSKIEKGNLAWVRKPIINMLKPTVVDEDDLLKKADSKKAKPSCHKKLEKIE